MAINLPEPIPTRLGAAPNSGFSADVDAVLAQAEEAFELLSRVTTAALDALKGIVDDDGPCVSLADQRARHGERMKAAKAALDMAGVTYDHYAEA